MKVIRADLPGQHLILHRLVDPNDLEGQLLIDIVVIINNVEWVIVTPSIPFRFSLTSLVAM